MEYRDDREALRERADALESELEASRRRAAKADELEEDVEAMQRRLEAMRAELARLRPPPAPRASGSSRSATLAAGIALAIGVTSILGVGVMLRARHSDAPPVAVATLPPVPLPPPLPTAPTPEPVVEEAPPAPEPRLLEVRLSGKVTTSNAPGLVRGAPCTLLAHVRAGMPPDARITSASVDCAGRTLYRSDDPLNGMSSLSTSAVELPGPEPGQSVFVLEYTDQGARSGTRNQASLTSRLRAGSVWRETAPAFRVDFSLDATSAPAVSTNESTLELPPVAIAAPLHATGVITERAGAAPVKGGATCTLDVMPYFEGVRCAVTATCGGTKLYDFGYAACAASDGALTSIADTRFTAEGGDPKLEYDAASKRLVISDEVAGGLWSVTVALR